MSDLKLRSSFLATRRRKATWLTSLARCATHGTASPRMPTVRTGIEMRVAMAGLAEHRPLQPGKRGCANQQADRKYIRDRRVLCQRTSRGARGMISDEIKDDGQFKPV